MREMGQGRDLLPSSVSFFTLRTFSQKGEFKLDLPQAEDLPVRPPHSLFLLIVSVLLVPQPSVISALLPYLL